MSSRPTDTFTQVEILAGPLGSLSTARGARERLVQQGRDPTACVVHAYRFDPCSARHLSALYAVSPRLPRRDATSGELRHGPTPTSGTRVRSATETEANIAPVARAADSAREDKTDGSRTAASGTKNGG